MSVIALAKPCLEAAQDDATRLAIGDMERAGIDIITDGEMCRESYSTASQGSISTTTDASESRYQCRAPSIAGNGWP
jgi:methionine synthase II (cobalamin-independent)